MRIGAIGDTASIRSGSARRRASEARADAEAPAIEARALVAVDPVTRSATLPVVRSRPLATFLAQLIATDQQLPQTRERRRAEPDVARAVYASALSRKTQGRILAEI